MSTFPLQLLPDPQGPVERRIYLIRGQKVMLDADLAELYQVETRALVQAVKRNPDRFPEDFMFQLSNDELNNLRSQIVISNPGAKKGLRYKPYAFTEQGVAMLSSVLRSVRAVQMSITIMRAFVRLRQVLITNQALEGRLKKVETTQRVHEQVLIGVVNDIKKMKNPPKTRAIGFRA